MLVRRRGRVLLIQWPEGRRWAGLWDFPRFAVQGKKEAEVHCQLVENVRRMTGVTILPGTHRKTLRHGVTRFRITLDCYDAEYLSNNGGGTESLMQKWVRPAELEHYPLSSTGRKLAGLVQARRRIGQRRATEYSVPSSAVSQVDRSLLARCDHSCNGLSLNQHPRHFASCALNICYGGADCLVHVCGLAMKTDQGHAIAHDGRAIIASGFEQGLGQVFAQIGFRCRNNGKIE